MIKRIHFESHGEGPELVICNGLSQSTANWRGMARANPHFRWILFDARGCGRSPLGKRPYTLDDHVDDLFWVLEQTDAVKPFVMGFSHGGRVATRAVACAPEKFSGLILTSVAANMTTRRNAHVMSWKKCLEVGGLRAMAWATLPNIVGPKILEKFQDWELLINGTINRNSEEGLTAMFEGMPSYPSIEEDARRIALPTIVFRGEIDPLLEPGDGRDLAEWSGGTEVIFPDCGHTLPLEETSAYMARVAQFIGHVNKGLS